MAGCVVHADRGSQFRSRKFVHAINRHSMVGSMGRVGAAGDNAAMESFFALLQEERPQPTSMVDARGTADRHRDLDREDLPPSPSQGRARTFDPDRIRVDHEAGRDPSGLTNTVTSSCSSPTASDSRLLLTRPSHWSEAPSAESVAMVLQAPRVCPVADPVNSGRHHAAL